MPIAPFVPPLNPPHRKATAKAAAAPPTNPSTYKPSTSKPSTSKPSTSNASTSNPSTSDPSTANRSSSNHRTQTRSQRQYRCSRCGKDGHNVRRCDTPNVWFRQRCGKCGGTGHNARNCPSTTFATCRVCKGVGRLPCSKCDGRGTDAPPPREHKAPLSDAQKIMADRIRQRVRRVVGTVGEDGLVLVGKDAAAKRCKRCLGRGFLSCMACC